MCPTGETLLLGQHHKLSQSRFSRILIKMEYFSNASEGSQCGLLWRHSDEDACLWTCGFASGGGSVRRGPSQPSSFAREILRVNPSRMWCPWLGVALSRVDTLTVLPVSKKRKGYLWERAHRFLFFGKHSLSFVACSEDLSYGDYTYPHVNEYICFSRAHCGSV